MAVAFVGPLSVHFAGPGGDAARLVPGIAAWREDLRASLAEKVRQQLDWDEAATAVFTADLGDSGWLAVRLLGLLAERPELEWPDSVPPLLELLPAWRAAAEARFATSHFGQLLACSVWLPGDFPVTFRAPLPDGSEAEIGAVQSLFDQLRRLNQRTFEADGPAIAGWRDLPAPAGGEFVAAARRGYAALHAAAAFAAGAGLPLVVAD